MSKNLSAKYYQENKETQKQKLMKDIKIFLKKEEKEKNNNVVVNATKVSQKLKNKNLLSIGKIL